MRSADPPRSTFVISTSWPPVARAPRKIPTTISREKSTGGAGGGWTCARVCRAQKATHSSRVRIATWSGSRIPLAAPFATVENGSAAPAAAPDAHAISGIRRPRASTAVERARWRPCGADGPVVARIIYSQREGGGERAREPHAEQDLISRGPPRATSGLLERH